MMTNEEYIAQGLTLIYQVEGVSFRPESLLEDVIYLLKTFDDRHRYLSAIEETVRELELLVSGKKKGEPLVNNHEGILSSHYQSIRVNGQKADLRIVYDQDSEPLRIRQFGHRHQPKDFYTRLQIRKNEESV